MPSKTFETQLLDALKVTLKSIEFDNAYEGDESAPHRDIFCVRASYR
jgi:hypothetical protein